MDLLSGEEVSFETQGGEAHLSFEVPAQEVVAVAQLPQLLEVHRLGDPLSVRLLREVRQPRLILLTSDDPDEWGQTVPLRSGKANINLAQVSAKILDRPIVLKLFSGGELLDVYAVKTWGQATFLEEAKMTYLLKVSPPEHKMMRDARTGVELLFVTTHPALDHSLYFHERSWLADSSLLLFTSQRPDGGLMGYLFATGELVHLNTPRGGLGGATAARDRNSVFACRGREIVEVALKIEPTDNVQAKPSRVTATERILCTLPENINIVTALNESADGALLSFGASLPGNERGVFVVDLRSGALREVCRVKAENFAGHVQFSRTHPRLISFAG